MPPRARVQFPLSSTPFPGSNIGRRAINFGDMLKCHCAGCYHAQRIPILRPQSHWTGGLNIFEPTETSWVAIIVTQSAHDGYVPDALEMARPLCVPDLGRDKRKDSVLGSGCAALVNFVSQACRGASF